MATKQGEIYRAIWQITVRFLGNWEFRGVSSPGASLWSKVDLSRTNHPVGDRTVSNGIRPAFENEQRFKRTTKTVTPAQIGGKSLKR